MKIMDDDKILNYSVAFFTVSAGLLTLSLIPSALGIRRVQKAKAFNLLADGHRLISLAKTYDAKAAALTIKQVSKVVK